jgi:hypothetical protein
MVHVAESDAWCSIISLERVPDPEAARQESITKAKAQGKYNPQIPVTCRVQLVGGWPYFLCGPSTEACDKARGEQELYYELLRRRSVPSDEGWYNVYGPNGPQRVYCDHAFGCRHIMGVN